MASQLRRLRGGRVSFFLFMDTITSVTAMLIMVSLMMTLYVGHAPEPSPRRREPSPAQLQELLTQARQLTTQNQWLRSLLALVSAAPDAERLRADIESLRAQVSSQSSSVAQLEARLLRQAADAQAKADALVLSEHRQQMQEVEQQIEAVRQTNQIVQAELVELKAKMKEAEAKLERAKHDESKLWLIPEADASGKRPLLVSLSATNLVCERFSQPESRKEFPASTSERSFKGLLGELNPDRDYLVFYIRPSGIAFFQRCNALAKSAGFNVGYDAVEEDKQLLFVRPQEP
jgi:hypothetical protein